MARWFGKRLGEAAPVESQYDQAIAAIRELFLESRLGKPPPSRDEVTDSLSPQATEWLAERVRAGIRDELVIAPLLDDQSELGDLVDVFNEQLKLWWQIWRARGWPVGWTLHLAEPWRRYSVRELNGEMQGPGWRVAVLLNDSVDPGKPGTPEALDHPGLVYTGLDHVSQHKALKSEQQSLRTLGISIEPMTPVEAILIDTQRILTRNALPKRVDAVGKVVPLVCQTGTTLFVQLRTQRQESSIEPVVGAVLEETTFRLWSPFRKERDVGVRRTMSVQPSMSVQPL